ncbi:MAG: hypothetical protein NZ700_10650 [Gemmataceae bacterium]|nr:hypothetical protein [Gemmataceae bacterium]MDW8264448.1 hypothetical protein [Gemmataceae bacterium]
MATWGEFLAEFQVMQMKPVGMVVKVDAVIDLWEERNRLRAEVEKLRRELAEEREACAREVEDFAEAIEHESEEAVFVAKALWAAAELIRDRGQPETWAEPQAQEPATAPEGPPGEA